MSKKNFAKGDRFIGTPILATDDVDGKTGFIQSVLTVDESGNPTSGGGTFDGNVNISAVGGTTQDLPFLQTDIRRINGFSFASDGKLPVDLSEINGVNITATNGRLPTDSVSDISSIQGVALTSPLLPTDLFRIQGSIIPSLDGVMPVNIAQFGTAAVGDALPVEIQEPDVLRFLYTVTANINGEVILASGNADKYLMVINTTVADIILDISGTVPVLAGAGITLNPGGSFILDSGLSNAVSVLALNSVGESITIFGGN